MQIQLSAHVSLDVVRLPGRRYRIVFAQRYGVHKREFVELSYEDALVVARFLAAVDNDLVERVPGEPVTLGGRPSKVPPREVRELLDEADRSSKHGGDQESDGVVQELKDPRTGALDRPSDDD